MRLWENRFVEESKNYLTYKTAVILPIKTVNLEVAGASDAEVYEQLDSLIEPPDSTADTEDKRTEHDISSLSDEEEQQLDVVSSVAEEQVCINVFCYI